MVSAVSGPSSPFRVARIITRLNVGGPALHAVLLTKGLDAERYETLLICGRPGPREGDMRELRGDIEVRPLVIPELGRAISPLDDVIAFVRLVRALRAFRPHIVHTHLAKAGLLGRVAARLVGTPIVVHTFHGNVLRGYFGRRTTRFLAFLERVLARLSTRIVVISPRQAAEIRSLGIATEPKLVEIPLGLELAQFTRAPAGRLRAELGVAPGTPLVGTVGRLVPIKGVDVFLDAAAEVARRLPDVLFIVLGDGPEREALARRAESLGLADRVLFFGWRRELPSIYQDLDVVVLTSHNEGTPVSVIEAFAAARPVVATAVGGTPDLFGDPPCGVLVGDGDARATAEGIVSLILDPEHTRELGRKARQRVFPERDVGTLLRRIDALYSMLLATISAPGEETRQGP